MKSLLKVLLEVIAGRHILKEVAEKLSNALSYLHYCKGCW